MSSNVQMALPILLSALGGKVGVKVNIGGNSVFTDGESITIPSLPMDGSPELRTLAYGYGGHEASHVKHTDMKLCSELAKKGEFARSILNIIEDIRIERAIMSEFPGLQSTLSDLVGLILTKEPRAFGNPTEKDNPANVLVSWLLISRRHRVLKQKALASKDADAEKVVRKVLGDDFVEKLEAILSDLPTMPFGKTNTIESVKVAQAILDLIQSESQDDKPEDSDDSDDSDDSEGSDDSDDSEGSEGSEGSDGSDGSDGSNSSGLKNSKNNIKKLAQGGDDAQGVDESLACDLGNVVKSLLENTVGEELSKKGNAAIRSLPFIENHVNGQPVDLMKAKLLSGPMRQRLRVLVQGNSNNNPVAKRVGTKLDSNRLSRVAIGDYRVFSKTSDTKDINAAVHVLLDSSGSMRMKNRMLEASLAALSLAEAFDSMKAVNLGVSHFGDGFGYIKHHNQKLNNVVRQNMSVYATGSTPLTEALVNISNIILSQPEKRKVVLVLTDGEPENEATAKSMVRALESTGVLLLGIGLSLDDHAELCMKDIFGCNYEAIKTAEEIREAMFKMISRIF